MGHMPRVHGRPIDQLGQVSGSAASGSDRELEVDDVEVRTQGGWTGGKGGLWDRETVWGD